MLFGGTMVVIWEMNVASQKGRKEAAQAFGSSLIIWFKVSGFSGEKYCTDLPFDSGVVIRTE
jgi:hypothetical protein